MDAEKLEDETKLLRPLPKSLDRESPSVLSHLGNLLVHHRFLTVERFREAQKLAKAEKIFLDQALVNLRFCSETQLVKAIAHAMQIEERDPSRVQPDIDYLVRVPMEYALQHACLPIEMKMDRLVVLMADPTEDRLLDDLTSMTGERIQPSVAPRSAVVHAIKEFYGMSEGYLAEANEMRRELGAQYREARQSGTRSYSFSLLSNKGGVGKTHTTINLAYTMAQMGFKVLVIDADMGNADVSNKLRLFPVYTLADFLDKTVEIEKTSLPTEYGFDVIPGKTGESRLANLKYFQRLRFMKGFARVSSAYDVVLYDLGAGVNLQVLDYALCADEMIIVTTPRDLVSGYACAKLAFFRHVELETRLSRQDRRYKLREEFQPWFLFNQLENMNEASEGYKIIARAAQQCSQSDERISRSGFVLSPAMLGGVLRDPQGYVNTERAHKPFCWTYPNHTNVQCYQTVTRALLNDVSRTGRPDRGNLGRVVKVVSGPVS